ncbi:hypothetical protein D9M71_380120 [compost metagenome]
MDQGLIDHCMGDCGAQVTLIVAQGAQGLFEFGSCCVLEQVTMSTQFERLHDQLRVGMHRKDQHLAAWARCQQALQCLKAAGCAHGDVEQDDVRVGVYDQLEQLRAIAGFCNHVVTGKIRDQGTHTGPDQ